MMCIIINMNKSTILTLFVLDYLLNVTVDLHGSYSQDDYASLLAVVLALADWENFHGVQI